MRSFQLEVKVTDETDTKAEKARYIEAVFDAFEALFGPPPTATAVARRSGATTSAAAEHRGGWLLDEGGRFLRRDE